MKKTKIDLQTIEVKSFTTSLEGKELKVTGGGTADWETCDALTQCGTQIAFA